MSKEEQKKLTETVFNQIQEYYESNKIQYQYVDQIAKAAQSLTSKSTDTKCLKILDENLPVFLKTYLEEKKYEIIMKSYQKLSSKIKSKEENKGKNDVLKAEKFDFLSYFKGGKFNSEVKNKKNNESLVSKECLFVYMETLMNKEFCQHFINDCLPVYFMLYYPEKSEIVFIIKSKEDINLPFIHVNTIFSQEDGFFLGIKFSEILSEYDNKSNGVPKLSIRTEKLLEVIRELPVSKANKLSIKYYENNLENARKIIKEFVKDFISDVKIIKVQETNLFETLNLICFDKKAK